MDHDVSQTMLEILGTTLADVERALDLAPTDPGLRELKLSIVRAIAELEVRRARLRAPEASEGTHSNADV